jgi:hypothetical protein
MKMLRYFSLRDPKVFLLCDQSGRCAFHLAAQYSESVVLLHTILQIDQAMTKSLFGDDDITPLGLLCRRLEFPTFHQMVTCLLEVKSSEEVVYDACIVIYINTESKDHRILPGSLGERTMTLLRFLLEANLDVMKHQSQWVFRPACRYLRGELGVAVLSLFITKNSSGLKFAHSNGCLPIHYVAMHSSVDVLKLLQSAYPELFTMLINHTNLLHLVFYGMCVQ